VRCSYMQIVSIVLNFPTTYEDHSEMYNAMASIFRDSTIPSV
jgi:hypothetical protein